MQRGTHLIQTLLQVKKPSTSGKSSDGRTQPIVDERGHIVKGGKKLTSFTPQLAAWQLCPTRWPAPNPAIKGTSAATMGYKGIPSDYLPSSTVQIKTRAIPGEKDGVHFE